MGLTAGTGAGRTKPGTAGLYQKWVSQACFCLGLASYKVAGRRAGKRSCCAGRACFREGLAAAKPGKTLSTMPSSSRRPMTKDQLLRRLQDHAASKGGLCLADCYLNSKTKVQWECEHGHRWHAAPINVLYGKTWCPQCAVERRMGSLERLRDHARQRGGRLLSTKYTNSQAKYRWQCKLGHTWEAAAYSVLNKRTWCPECARKQKVFIRRSLQDLQEHAASRGGRCLATKYCGVRMKVQWECTKGHRWPATPTAVLYQNSWCPVCAQRAPIGLERLRDHAAQRGGECLATEYVNNCSKVAWKCKHGHAWQATAHSVMNMGSWCPHCRKIGLRRLQAHAASLGGRCLAKSYKNRSTNLLWECREGHRWKAMAQK